MIIDRLLAVAELITFRDWILQMVKGTIVLLMLYRVGSNIREILFVRGLRVTLGRYYTGRHWGARPAALLLLLIVESMVVMVLGGLTLIILG